MKKYFLNDNGWARDSCAFTSANIGSVACRKCKYNRGTDYHENYVICTKYDEIDRIEQQKEVKE